MPKLSALVPDRATVEAPFGGDVLHVAFNPQKFTPRLLNGALSVERRGALDEALLGPLAALILEWDLTDNDGSPYPITAASLGEMPLQVLDYILDVIQRTPEAKAATVRIPRPVAAAVPVVPPAVNGVGARPKGKAD